MSRDHGPLAERVRALLADRPSTREVGPGWLDVPADRTASDEGLRCWVETALAYVEGSVPLPGERRRRPRR